jgi:aryl-alcohol dehydrogenase-like predicted oxidoreductase
MLFRDFGKTGMRVSEVGFGAWGIGGDFGRVEKSDALAALARAEERGCNFVDTAGVYGDSEELIGEFLPSRRDRWFLATKYSGQDGGLIATAERQLQKMHTDHLDFYQIHWAPSGDEAHLYDDLYKLKESGKARFVGVSLYSVKDIDYVLDHTKIDGFQVAFSLLDPQPFLARRDRIRQSGVGVIIRSCLKEGFLTGKFTADATFTDESDQRSQWSRAQIRETVAAAERFRFLEGVAGSMMLGAARYPLSFPETSTLILGTKSAAQADVNFGQVPGAVLDEPTLEQIKRLQASLGARSLVRRALSRVRRGRRQ